MRQALVSMVSYVVVNGSSVINNPLSQLKRNNHSGKETMMDKMPSRLNLYRFGDRLGSNKRVGADKATLLYRSGQG
jgi:hypothetical protein